MEDPWAERPWYSIAGTNPLSALILLFLVLIMLVCVWPNAAAEVARIVLFVDG